MQGYPYQKESDYLQKRDKKSERETDHTQLPTTVYKNLTKIVTTTRNFYFNEKKSCFTNLYLQRIENLLKIKILHSIGVFEILCFGFY